MYYILKYVYFQSLSCQCYQRRRLLPETTRAVSRLKYQILHSIYTSQKLHDVYARYRAAVNPCSTIQALFFDSIGRARITIVYKTYNAIHGITKNNNKNNNKQQYTVHINLALIGISIQQVNEHFQTSHITYGQLTCLLL